MSQKRLYLSPPHLSQRELEYVTTAIQSNWITPLGPCVDEFERRFRHYVGVRGALALSSGTAALHLCLRHLNLQPADEVLCSTLTFCASANPIVYERAAPVFIDSDAATWNLDPNLLEDELRDGARRGKLPRAVIVADIFGQSADLDAIRNLASPYGIPVIEDAAEALGATYHGRAVGASAWASFFSFNGNKIITTSGGGMLCSNDPELIEHARFLATQARDPAPHYQHSEIGYNYRLSNVLAGIGLAQLEVLDQRVQARRANFDFYRDRLADLPGVSLMPEALYGRANRWLTVILIDPQQFGATREDVRLALAADEIESRPVWKPLHCQPVFGGCRRRGGAVAERLFERGLCLPSGSAMTEQDLTRVIDGIRAVHSARGRVQRRAA
jgi:dTDP-4-amino-4,6-dideoxygalactose transaminase